MQCGQCGDSWRWSDAGRDAFSLVLAGFAGSMAPVEDQHGPDGVSRAARFELCLAVRYRMDGDDEWRRGMSANISRSGMLFHASSVGALSPQRRTDATRRLEVVIEATTGAVLSQVRCLATVARVLEPAPLAELGAVGVTIGDYILRAH